MQTANGLYTVGAKFIQHDCPLQSTNETIIAEKFDAFWGRSPKASQPRTHFVVGSALQEAS